MFSFYAINKKTQYLCKGLYISTIRILRNLNLKNIYICYKKTYNLKRLYVKEAKGNRVIIPKKSYSKGIQK